MRPELESLLSTLPSIAEVHVKLVTPFFVFTIFFSGQLFESYFLTPKLVGEAIKLNPIWIIFALMTGAYLSGLVGVLISLPIAAIIGVVVRHYFTKFFF